jgi:DNA-binding transcriptional ArsR family regulator
MATKTVSVIVSGEELARTARAIKAMAHPIRWRILCFLGNKEFSVNEIIDHTGASPSSISQHLTPLRVNNVIVYRRVANKTLYSISDMRTLNLIDAISKSFCQPDRMSL